jgi:cell wall-associated NlpC family hydrolase
MQTTRPRIPAHGLSASRTGTASAARVYLAAFVSALVVFVLGWTCASAKADVPDVQQASKTADRALQKANRTAARRRWLEQRVVYLAWRATGIPYRWGGTSPRSGFDCSGLATWVYSHVGVRLPHYTYAQWRYGRPVGRGALRAGDLLFFSGLRHVGIYIGGGRLIHAPHAGTRVQVARLSGWFASSFVGARRLVAV